MRVSPGDTRSIPLVIEHNGEPIDADALPTAALWLDGASLYSLDVTHAGTGEYMISLVIPPTAEQDDVYQIRAVADVDGVARTRWLGSWQVDAAIASRASQESVDAINAASINAAAAGFLSMVDEHPEIPGAAQFLASAFTSEIGGLTPEQAEQLAAIRGKVGLLGSGVAKVVSPITLAGVIGIDEGFDYVGITIAEKAPGDWNDDMLEAGEFRLYARHVTQGFDFDLPVTLNPPGDDGLRSFSVAIPRTAPPAHRTGGYNYHVYSVTDTNEHRPIVKGRLELSRGKAPETA